MEEKRQLILKSALELFVDNGFHATPTSLIASNAGVANGTLFHYFKTKEELINLLYLETKDEFFKNVTQEFNASNDLKDRVYSIWFHTIDWAIHNQYEFRFLQQFANSPFISQLTLEQISRHHQIFEDEFENGIKRKEIKDLPVSLLLQLSLSHIYGFISYLIENPGYQSDREIMEMTFNCYWDSIKLY